MEGSERLGESEAPLGKAEPIRVYNGPLSRQYGCVDGAEKHNTIPDWV